MRLRPALLTALVVAVASLHPSAEGSEPKALTQLTLTSSSNPSIAGAEVTFRVAVSTHGPTLETLATGDVEFYDGPTLLGTVALAAADGRATATLSTPALLEGAHPILARYGGDERFLPGASEPLTHIVNPAQ